MGTIDLDGLDATRFQHLVNAVALAVLGGPGLATSSPGPAQGQDGYFYGEAPYPSATDRWEGRWYVQAKHHVPIPSRDPQKWLIAEVSKEVGQFTGSNPRRSQPDIWIVASNIDLAEDTLDECRKLVANAMPKLAEHFEIWGRADILDLAQQAKLDAKYGVTAAQAFTSILDAVPGRRGDTERILRFLIEDALTDYRDTKIEQAGALVDVRPGVHSLFTDMPVDVEQDNTRGSLIRYLLSASADAHGGEPGLQGGDDVQRWRTRPERAPICFIKGGPGQGKSTACQYYAQVQRAALVLALFKDPALQEELALSDPVKGLGLAREILKAAEGCEAWSADDDTGRRPTRRQAKRRAPPASRGESKGGGTFIADEWPTAPRVPIVVALKDYAQWYAAAKMKRSERSVLKFISVMLTDCLHCSVQEDILQQLLGTGRWCVIFDGLDEVPSNIKDSLAAHVRVFLETTARKGDIFSICTSRPQGYSRQFDLPLACRMRLPHLPLEAALKCAGQIVRYGRTRSDAARDMKTLKEAAKAQPIKELMVTPLQAHIMAVVVRDGGQLPGRRWSLYSQFYEIIQKREANHGLVEKKVSQLLRDEAPLLKALHSHLGLLLHVRSASASTASADLPRNEFIELVRQVVTRRKRREIKSVVETLTKATTQRLVLINTPEEIGKVRFEIRSLQEFFAAEALSELENPQQLHDRLLAIGSDPHWREVMHFVLSGLVDEMGRRVLLEAAHEALCKLDDGPGAAPSLLFQELGAGTIAVGRLLSDGVLDHDFSLRTKFRSLLTAAGYAANADVIADYCATRSAESRLWIVESLLDDLGDEALNERPGTARILWHLIDDEDPMLAEVLPKYERLPFRDVFSLALPLLGSERLRDWHRSVVASTFANAAPQEIAYLRIKPPYGDAASEIWRRGANALVEAVRKRDGEVAAKITSDALYWVTYPATPLLKLDWITLGEYRAESPWARSTSTVTEKALEGLAPSFQYLAAVVECAAKHTRSAASRLLSLLPDTASAIPLDAMADFDGLLRDLLERHGTIAATRKCIDDMSDSEFATLAAKAPWRYFITHIESPSGKRELSPEQVRDDLVQIARVSPRAAIEAMSYLLRCDRRLNAESHSVEIAKVLQGLTQSDPTWVRDHPVLWGHLFAALTPEQGRDLRRALIRERPSCRWRTLSPHIEEGAELKPFHLTLPDEAELLPAITGELIRVAWALRRSETAWDRDDFARVTGRKATSRAQGYPGRPQELIDAVADIRRALVAVLAQEFAGDPKELLEVVADGDRSLDVRLAALMLAALNPGEKQPLLSHRKFLEAALSGLPGAGVPFAVLCEHVGLRQDPLVHQLLAIALEAGQQDPGVAFAWAEILSHWRAESDALVNTSSTLKQILPPEITPDLVAAASPAEARAGSSTGRRHRVKSQPC